MSDDEDSESYVSEAEETLMPEPLPQASNVIRTRSNMIYYPVGTITDLEDYDPENVYLLALGTFTSHLVAVKALIWELMQHQHIRLDKAYSDYKTTLNSKTVSNSSAVPTEPMSLEEFVKKHAVDYLASKYFKSFEQVVEHRPKRFKSSETESPAVVEDKDWSRVYTDASIVAFSKDIAKYTLRSRVYECSIHCSYLNHTPDDEVVLL